MKVNIRLCGILFVTLFLFGLKTASAQISSPPKTQNNANNISNYRKNLVEIVKNNSAFSNSLNWKEIEKELSRKSVDLTSLSDASELANYLITN